ANLYGALGSSMPGSGTISVTLYALLIIGGLNTVLSLFYYIKVLKVMVLEKSLEEVEGRPVEPITVGILHRSYVSLLVVVLWLLGIFWAQLARASYGEGVSNFQNTPNREQVLAQRGEKH